MVAGPAACVRKRRDERGESSDGLLRPKDEGALDEEVDDQPEDGAATDELAEAHGVLESIGVTADGSLTLDRRLQRRIAP